MKMFLALDKPDFDRCLMESFQIGLEIVRADMTNLENVNGYGAVLSGQQAGERKAVTTIVTLAAVNGEGAPEMARPFQPGQTACRRPLHQVEGGDRLMLDGICIPGPDLLGRKNFHAENYAISGNDRRGNDTDPAGSSLNCLREPTQAFCGGFFFTG